MASGSFEKVYLDADKEIELFKAKIWKLGDDIDTDIILPTEYLAYETVEDMKPYAFSPLRPELAAKIQPGDMIVAGHNFGCGSSREQAPSVLKALGVKAVVAKSFARIFYRNSINIGMPVIVSKELYDVVNEGDDMELDLEQGIIKTGGNTYSCTKLPAKMQEILDQGGLIASLNQ